MKRESRKRKKETEKYIEKFDQRLMALDKHRCIQRAKREIRESSISDLVFEPILATFVSKMFRLSVFDLCLLADRGEIKAYRRRDCSEPLFNIFELLEFFQSLEYGNDD